MGQKSKKGKQRKDKFYHLAKESGYRARSAFKLIQLNRKLSLLESARVAIDLCAAPGGWLQVLQNCMPVSSLILGVDLVPIKPIPNVITLQDDITTDSCVSALSKHLQTWKADIVLNDGAPNVGQSWVQDAFTQSKLTLAAFKIAVKFLKKGGCFVTKIFRSKDYLALNWVFKQLFFKVKATKPQASRNESAEIYVICQNFKAPDKVDPKFFDIKHVFKDVTDPDEPGTNTDKLLIGQTTKAKALGYDGNNLSVYKDAQLTTFLKEDNFIPILNFCSQMKFDDPEIESHPLTTDEIKEYCKDIQLLSKIDVKKLLKWRSKIRTIFAKKLEISEVDKEPLHSVQTAALTEEEKEVQLEEHLAKIDKKRKAKLREQKVKLRQKMALGVNATIEEDETLFNLSAMKSKKQLKAYEDSSEMVGNDGFEETDATVYDDVNAGNSKGVNSAAWLRSKTDHITRNEWMKDLYSDIESSSDSEIDLDEDEEEDENNEIPITDAKTTEDIEQKALNHEPNPLLATGNQKITPTEKALQWYANHEVFADVTGANADLDIEKDLSEDETVSKKSKKKMLRASKSETVKAKEVKRSSETEAKKKREAMKAANMAAMAIGGAQNQNRKTNVDEIDEASDEEDIVQMSSSDSNSDSDDSDSDVEKSEYDVGKVTKNQLLKRKLTAEQLALGHEIAFSAKRRREIIESGFHRFAYNDENDLPKWFQHEESRHTQPIIPVSKEIVQMYRERLKEINARPIKKVAEARARKKMKMTKKLENIKGKAEKIANTPGASEREKLLQIKGLYKKAKVNKKLNREKTYVVAKKNRTKAVNPSKGSKKGPVKFVDKRLKADKKNAKQKGSKSSKNKKAVKVPQKINKKKNISKNRKR